MAATKYQLLYRYINESTNTPISNNMSNEYEKTEEFYTDDHKIASDDETIQLEAENEKEEMISYGNSTSNPKNDMLFIYDGTKKIRHQKWVGETAGCYVVRDWQSLDRRLIGNRGDFSKDFTTIDGESPEMGGKVICKNLAINNKYFPNAITVVNNNDEADKVAANGKPYYSEAKITNLITNATIFALKTNDYKEYGTESNKITKYKSNYSTLVDGYIYTGPVAVGNNPLQSITYWPYKSSTMSTINNGSISEANLYGSFVIKPTQIETTTIPGHYEDTNEYPYVIKDTYKRVKMTPWFIHATYGSLESALEKARILIDMIGIENVKLIKVVPFDQFVKIQ